MSEETNNSSSGEQKRPAQPVLSNQEPPEKKAKNKMRLSSVAQRALAALGDDSDSSSSDDDLSIGSPNKEVDSPVTSMSEDGGTKRGRESEEISAPQPSARDVALGDSQNDEAKIDPPEQPKHSKADNNIAENGSHVVHKSSDEQKATPENSRRKADKQAESQHVQTLDSDVATTSQSSPVTQSDVNMSKQDLSTAYDEIVEDEAIVYPHTAKSEYSDILSSFTNIPFDDMAMLTLHKSKEGTGLGQDRNRLDSYQRWILSHRDSLPIIPQKQFFTKMNGAKESASKQQGESIDHAESPLTPAAINAEVTEFLMQESQKLIESPLPFNNEPHHDEGQDQSSKQQSSSTLHPTSQQKVVHQTQTDSNNETNSSIDQRHLSLHNQTSNAHPPAQSQSFRQTQTQQYRPQQQHSQHQYQPNLTQFQPPNYFGFGHQQQQYYPGPMFNSFNNLYQNMNPGHQQQNNGHWTNQYYAAPPPFPINGVSNGYNNPRYTPVVPAMPSAAPAPAPTPVSAPPLVHDRTARKVKTTASVVRKLKKSNNAKATIAKLPVGFGFWLDDKDGLSKKLALQAKRTWLARGKMAVEKECEKQSKMSTPSGRSSKAGGSPKQPSSSSSTPKTPRTPASLLSSAPAPGLPDGWITKTFRRVSGKTAGTTDKYFYSPQEKIKFRAMKSCKTFLEILGEPGVDGNEKNAFKAFKERGHKV